MGGVCLWNFTPQKVLKKFHENFTKWDFYFFGDFYFSLWVLSWAGSGDSSLPTRRLRRKSVLLNTCESCSGDSGGFYVFYRRNNSDGNMLAHGGNKHCWGLISWVPGTPTLIIYHRISLLGPPRITVIYKRFRGSVSQLRLVRIYFWIGVEHDGALVSNF